MKKLFTLLCMALLSAAGFAQDAYDPNEHTAFVSGTANMFATNEKGEGWQATDEMTYDSESGLWKITLAAKDTKAIEFKVVYDKEWYGKDGNNYQFQVSEPSDVLITFDPNTLEATYSGDKVKEYDPNAFDYVVVAGSATLLGADWDVTAEANKMTEEEEGYFVLQLKDVTAGSYEFKFAADGGWATQWGAADVQLLTNKVALPAVGGSNPSNFKLVLEKGYKYNLTLILDNMDIDNPTVTAEWEQAGTDEVKEDVYSIAGTMNGWNQADTSTEMTMVSEGVYSITISMQAGEQKFKVVTNHDWSVAYPAEDYYFELEEDADVTITLDLNNGGAISVETAPCTVYFVTVNVQSDKEAVMLYACQGEAWDKLTGEWPGVAMNKVDGGFTYTVKVTKGETLQLIFNGDGGQTADIKLDVIKGNRNLEYILNDDWTFSVGSGIQSVETEKVNGVIYNVAGQRVSKATRGLYIINGKKILK